MGRLPGWVFMSEKGNRVRVWEEMGQWKQRSAWRDYVGSTQAASVTESKLARLLAQKANEWEELANQSLKRMPGSFIDQRWGEERNKIKRPLMLQISPSLARCGRCNFFLPAIYRWTQLWTNAFQVTDRGRILWGRPLYIIVITEARQSSNVESELTSPCNTSIDGKDKEADSPLSTQKARSPANTSALAQWGLCRPRGLLKCEMMHWCC